MTDGGPRDFHLAQLNVGRLLAPIDDRRIVGFVALLEPINALAERSPGFVWRLATADGDATGIHVFDDDLMIINLTVWESIESLRAFVYTTGHTAALRRRREWFSQLAEAHLALWWVPAGHLPDTAESLARLDRLRRDGPTPEAFTFRTPFGPPDDALPRPSLVDAEFCWPQVVPG